MNIKQITFGKNRFIDRLVYTDVFIKMWYYWMKGDTRRLSAYCYSIDAVSSEQPFRHGVEHV